MVFHSEEHGLRVFGNRVLRKIFGPEWRKSHNEELHNLCTTPDVTGD